MAPPDLVALADPERFAALVADLSAARRPESPRPPDRVPATSLWIVDGEIHIGFLQIRHTLNDFLLNEGGQIGYSVRPSARRRGHARAALRDALPVVRSRGIDRVLVTCDQTNVASRATIEGNGGVYDDCRAGKRRYWIRTSFTHPSQGAGPLPYLQDALRPVARCAYECPCVAAQGVALPPMRRRAARVRNGDPPSGRDALSRRLRAIPLATASDLHGRCRVRSWNITCRPTRPRSGWSKACGTVHTGW